MRRTGLLLLVAALVAAPVANGAKRKHLKLTATVIGHETVTTPAGGKTSGWLRGQAAGIEEEGGHANRRRERLRQQWLRLRGNGQTEGRQSDRQGEAPHGQSHHRRVPAVLAAETGQVQEQHRDDLQRQARIGNDPRQRGVAEHERLKGHVRLELLSDDPQPQSRHGKRRRVRARFTLQHVWITRPADLDESLPAKEASRARSEARSA